VESRPVCALSPSPYTTNHLPRGSAFIDATSLANVELGKENCVTDKRQATDFWNTVFDGCDTQFLGVYGKQQMEIFQACVAANKNVICHPLSNDLTGTLNFLAMRVLGIEARPFAPESVRGCILEIRGNLTFVIFSEHATAYKFGRNGGQVHARSFLVSLAGAHHV
jgi:hypothetical protein